MIGRMIKIITIISMVVKIIQMTKKVSKSNDKIRSLYDILLNDNVKRFLDNFLFKSHVLK